MARLTRQQILDRKLGREEITLPSGDSVIIRGLSRSEGHVINRMSDSREAELFALSHCLLDPELTMAELSVWLDNDAGGDESDINATVRAIQGLSKNSPTDGKELTKSVPDE